MKACKTIIIPLCICVLFLLGACRTAPIKNIDMAPIPGADAGQVLSMNQVEKAITIAGSELGWTVSVQSPGLIVATLKLRQHLCSVNITYTTTTYSITYKDSTNLKYDGSKISSDYIRWIQNLDKGIKTNLAKEAYSKPQ